MYCPKCGERNEETAGSCSRCGERLQAASAAPIRVSNYLVPAIVVTLACCVPLGVPAIVYAARVNPRLQAGDVEGALEASAKARMWCWIAFAVGLIVDFGYLGLMVFSAFVGQE